MIASQSVLTLALWFCLGVVLYVYAGYPLLVFCLARLFGRRGPADILRDENLPKLSLLIAAYNEDSVIIGRIENALAMDYPADKLEIVVTTDGCADRTAEFACRYVGRGIRLIENRERRGKAAALNAALPTLQGDIVMFSDANTYTEPDAGRQLVRWFQDPSVSTVCGRLILTDPETNRNSDSLYWRYETFIKKQEGRLGALLGANGGIYAIRKDRYVPIPDGTILDDMVIPLISRLHFGGAIVYESRAVANEETPANVTAEFHRRSRIGAGGFGSLSLLAGLLNPASGWVFFTFLSHKLLRWTCPFFLIGLMATNILLAEEPFYWGLLLAQVAFYATSIAAAYLPTQPRALKVLRLTTMFTSMNGALLVGFGRWVRGSQRVTWKRTARLAEAQPAGVHSAVAPPVGAWWKDGATNGVTAEALQNAEAAGLLEGLPLPEPLDQPAPTSSAKV
jgi:cellulose synthase/poly-beta-1,6-N-acetylglucosamine synthase-like glycosyltransferase